MTPAHAGLQRLRDAAEDGRLAAVCRSRDVRLLVAFGSAVDPSVAHPRDLDLAVRFRRYSAELVIPLLTDLVGLAGTSEVDVLVLDTAGAVAREQALVFGEALYAEDNNLHAEEQIAATLQRLDTAPLRRLHLELLAEGRNEPARPAAIQARCAGRVRGRRIHQRPTTTGHRGEPGPRHHPGQVLGQPEPVGQQPRRLSTPSSSTHRSAAPSVAMTCPTLFSLKVLLPRTM